MKVTNFNYGYFRLRQFINPCSRNKVLKKFVAFYDSQDINPKNLPSVICHSFGTYILYMAMKKFEHIKFDKVILCGSILSEHTEWEFLFNRGQLNLLYNDYGELDNIVRLSSFIRGCGKAGKIGFSDIPPLYKEKILQKMNFLNHSEYFSDRRMLENWGGKISLPKIKYDKKILRSEIIERIYTNIDDNDIRYSRLSYKARIDEKGNYFACYSQKGVNNKNQELTDIAITTTADSTDSFADMDFQAIDNYGNQLKFKPTLDIVTSKKLTIYLAKPIQKNEDFYIQYRFAWKQTINIKLGDTDHWAIKNADKISISLNFSRKLNAAKFFAIQEHEVITTIPHEQKDELDGTITYCIPEFNNEFDYDGIIFYFESSHEPVDRKNTQAKTQAMIKKIRNVQGNKDSNTLLDEIIISRCAENQIRSVYQIESAVEHGNAATEHTLKERLNMFNDGFLLAVNKSTNEIVGYIESVIWNDFNFSTFEEIRNFPLYYDVSGNVLYIIFVAVTETYRNKGVCAKLLEEIEKVATKYNNVEKIKLVAKDGLVELYSKFQYHEVRPLHDFLKGKQYKSILMEKYISR